MDKTIQLYTDKNKQIKGYPITSPDRVLYGDGKSIKDKIKKAVKFEVVGEGDTTPPIEGELDNIKEQVESINEQLVNMVNRSDMNKIQQQVNDLVLGAVGDGNNAEVVQARNGSRLLNDRLAYYDNIVNYKYINILTSSQKTSIKPISGFTNTNYIDSTPVLFDFSTMNPLNRTYIGQKYVLDGMTVGRRYFAMGTARLVQGGSASVAFNNIGKQYSPKNFGVDMSSNLTEGATNNPLTAEWCRFGVMFDYQSNQTGLEFIVNSSSKNAIVEVKELMLFDVGDFYTNPIELNTLVEKGYIFEKCSELKAENRIKNLENKAIVYDESLEKINSGIKDYNLITNLAIDITGEYATFTREGSIFNLSTSTPTTIRTVPLNLEIGKNYYVVVKLLEGSLYGYSNKYFTLNRIDAGLYRDKTNVLDASTIIKKTDNLLIYKYSCTSTSKLFYGGLGNVYNGYTYTHDNIKISISIVPEEYYIDEYSGSNTISLNDCVGAIHPKRAFELFDKNIMYFSENGDDNNSGIMPNQPKKTIDKWIKNGNITCLLKSGDTFYTSLNVGSNTVLSSYGGNKKPIISGVRKSGNKIESIGENLYSVTLDCIDVGFIRLLGETTWNMKRKVISGSNIQEGEFHYDKPTKTLKIYSTKDISGMYVEYTDGATGLVISSDVNNVLIDNIEIYGFGVHGIETKPNISNITVENCHVSMIGGAFLPYKNIKLGNGIQIWMHNSNNIFIRNNIVQDCFDAGLTHQFTGTPPTTDHVISDNIIFENNIVKRCYWDWECYNDCATQDCHVIVRNNIFLDGLDITNGYRENSDINNQGLMLIRTSKGANDKIEIKDNILIKSTLNPIAFSLGGATNPTEEIDKYEFSNNIIACHTNKIYKYPNKITINNITSEDITIIKYKPKTFEEMAVFGYVNGELASKLASIAKF